MVTMLDTVNHGQTWFDGEKYIQLQTEKIKERIAKFPHRLYLEIGGKFLYDAHAARVLAWFDPESKKKIFSNFVDDTEILFNMNAKDLVRNRQFTSENISYAQFSQNVMNDIEEQLGIKPIIVINMLSPNFIPPEVQEFTQAMKLKEYRVYQRYSIDDYPDDVDTILSDNWFGKDEHIPLEKHLILVTWPGSSSGKMSTCLGQVYLDHLNGQTSWYAKYETFPIWNVELDHPVNLAYEAATADIDDYNVIDHYHKKFHGTQAVNYNRDVDAFEIIMNIADQFLDDDNFMTTYKSPTDMGISNAGFCITDNKVLAQAAYDEIIRRKDWYQTMINKHQGEPERIEKCEELLTKCKKWM